MPSCVKDEVVVFYRRNRKGLRVIWGQVCCISQPSSSVLPKMPLDPMVMQYLLDTNAWSAKRRQKYQQPEATGENIVVRQQLSPWNYYPSQVVLGW